MAKKATSKKTTIAETAPASSSPAGSVVLLADGDAGKKGAIVRLEAGPLADALAAGAARRATLRDFQIAGLAPRGFAPGG